MTTSITKELLMPFDWDKQRTAEEWKGVALEFARMWSRQNWALMVDPSYVHWLSATISDSRLFRIDDPQLHSDYIKHLDRRHVG